MTVTLDTIRTQLRRAKRTAKWANNAAFQAMRRVRALEDTVAAYAPNSTDPMLVALRAEIAAAKEESRKSCADGPYWRISRLANFIGAEVKR